MNWAPGIGAKGTVLLRSWVGAVVKRRHILTGFAGGVAAAMGLQSCGADVSERSLLPSAKAKALAVVVNQADPLSVAIARYYQQRRAIPEANLIRLEFDPNRKTMPAQEFEQLKRQVDASTPPHIQGYALTWAAPYRVDGMSITSAFAFGFDEKFCAEGCQPTAENPYFNQFSQTPYQDFQVRPTMALAALNFAQAKALIDRGIAADFTHPAGTAYLLSTSDRARNVRAQFYLDIEQALSPYFSIKVIHSNILRDRLDVMFYFTGSAQVRQIESNLFLPGAIADHLTSLGGMLTDSHQMSSLRWLEAGATGSYGTVVEPCNFPQKFPHPGILMLHYLNGDTLLQAYWKSVLQPGQGIFIGEPLAQPFAPLLRL